MSIPPLKSVRYTPPMTVALASFAFALLQALGIHARVMARDGLILRPLFVSKAIARRLRTGVRALEAYLRRMLVLMALELEHDLVAVHRPENLTRAKEKAKPRRVKSYSLRIYPPDTFTKTPHFAHRYAQERATSPISFTASFDLTRPPVVVPISAWLARLDHLHALSKDPTAKARRLAYSLARSRHGILMAPDEPDRKMRRWGMEASAIFDAMAYQIMTKSRSRPPPLPPPRRGPKPTITVFW